ncbi:MAG TPA: ABC transporter permease [Actinophytocola sp.]|jgi:putative ABC transport system permease protein|uniref:ABC transporter permease n=1 Tax=Actinophytocola sp. TaxID=1872138 RepID=UPI002F93D9BA
MLKAALKGLLARKLRLTLAGLAVVLGVMAVSAAMITTTTIGSGFDSIFQTVNSGVDVSVSGKSNVDPGMGGKGFTPPVPASVVDEIEKVPGVAKAVGEVSTDGARPIGPDGKVISVQGPPRFGKAWHGEAGMVRLRQGRGPAAPDEVAINAGLAELGGYEVGGTIDVLTLQPRKTFHVVGVYGFSNGLDTLGGSTEVSFTEPVAQQLMLGKQDTFSSITVTAAAGVTPEQLKDRVADAVGSGYLTRTGDELADQTAADGKAFLDIVRIVLLGFSGLSLLVGIFLILNTFSILVAQRTGELALMAALGARRRQIVGAVLVEATLVGSIASVAGIGLGLGVSVLLKSVMEANSGAQLPVGLIVPAGDLVLAFVLGVAVTLVAALLPAIRASRVPPVAAMRASAAEQRSLARITVLGAVPFVLGVAGMVASVVSDLDGYRWAVLGGGVGLALLGLALLTPVASRVLLPAVGRLLSWSMPGKLGRRNAERNPRRTAITVATLVVTLGLVGGVGVVAESLRKDVTTRVGSDLAADFVISGDGVTGKAGGQGGGPPTAADGRIMPTFEPSVITDARALPGVAEATAQYVDTVQVSGAAGKRATTPANAGSVTELRGVLGLERVSGSLRDLRSGEVVVDSKTLTELGREVGGTVEVATQRGGWQTYRIVGSYKPNFTLNGPVLAPADAQRQFVSDQPAMGYVKLRPGADVAAVKKGLTGLVAGNPEVAVQDQTQAAADASSQVDIAEVMLYVLLGLSVVIGVLGIVNTMALSILERTRELGLLRAVGMRRSHMVHMVVAESVVIAVFGGLLGLVFGGLAGAAVVSVAGLAELAVPWTSLAVFLGLSVVAGLLAALAPSARAAKVNVLSAIAYE